MNKLGLVFSVGALALLTACSSGESKEDPDETAAAAEQPAAETPSTSANDGVDEKAMTGLLAEFPEKTPERLITTSVPLAEMLDLLKVTPVGVPTSTNPLPENFENIDQIGSPMQPDLEVVASLTPDLLLGAESLRSTLEQSLKGMDVPAAYLPTDSFDDLKLSFKTLGTYFGKTDEMDSVLNKLTEKEVELAEKGKGKDLPTALLVIGTADSFMVMNDESYVGSLVKKLGADNIATSVLNVEDRYSPINMEDVVAADPDVILVLASGDHGASEEAFRKEVESNETWTKLSAYQNDKIEVLDYEVFGVTSILHAEQALTEISNYFYE